MTRKPSDTTTTWADLRARLDRAGTVTLNDAKPTRKRTAQILEDRARALAEAPPASAAPGRTLEIVRFTLDGEQMGLETRFVRAIGRDPVVTPIPSSPDFVLGVTSFRSEIIAVFDLRAIVPGPRAGGQHPRILFLGRDAVAFAILADAVDEVVQAPADTLSRRPWRADDPAAASGLTPDAVNLLDGAALLDDERFFIDQSSPFHVGERP